MNRPLSFNQLAYCQTMARRLITARRRRRDEAFHTTWYRASADLGLAQGTAWMIILAIIDVPYGTPYSTPAGHRTWQLSSVLERPDPPATAATSEDPSGALAVTAAEDLVAAAAQVLVDGSTGPWALAWDAFTTPTLTDAAITALAEIAIRLWTVRHGTRRRRAARHARRAVHLAYCRPWRRQLYLTRRHLRYLCRPRVPNAPWGAPRVRLGPQLRPITIPAFPDHARRPPT